MAKLKFRENNLAPNSDIAGYGERSQESPWRLQIAGGSERGFMPSVDIRGEAQDTRKSFTIFFVGNSNFK